MKFVLFRHAHKGIMPYDDPELSAQGFAQALRISELAASLPTPNHLWVSPKKRAAQSFYPLSKKLNLNIETKLELDQQNQQESGPHFRMRVQKFLNQLEDMQNPTLTIFACTHYDWIEEAMTLINSDKDLKSFEFLHWSPAQYVEFEIRNNLWTFIKKGAFK